MDEMIVVLEERIEQEISLGNLTIEDYMAKGEVTMLLSSVKMAIEKADHGQWDYSIMLPDGTMAKAGELIRGLRLDGFLKPN